MNKRFLIFYDDIDFDELKSYLEEKYLIKYKTDKKYQTFSTKIDNIKYDLFILPTELIYLDSGSNAFVEGEINFLNFTKEEIFGFNCFNDKFCADDIFPYFESFKDEDGDIYLYNFEDLDLKSLPKVKVIQNESNIAEEVIDKQKSTKEIEEVVNLIITGSFSSGKTSFLNILNEILVDNYDESMMWLPSFNEETTLGLFKISYHLDTNKIILENENGIRIDSEKFPIGKGKKILELHKKYFEINKEIIIKFPLKKKYKENIFKNLVIVDTPGLKSTNKTFEKMKSSLNNLKIKGYLWLIKTSDVDKNFAEKSINKKDTLFELVKQILPDENEYYVFDLFLNEVVRKSDQVNYNFETVNIFKDLIFQHSNLFPISTNIATMNFENIQDSFLERESLLIFLEKFYFKVLLVEELKILQKKHDNIISQKQKDLEPINIFLEDLKPYSKVELDLNEFLLQIARVFFNNHRYLYEQKIINKNIIESDKKIISKDFNLFIDDIFSKFSLKDKSSNLIINEISLNPIQPVLSSLETLNSNFPEYFLNLKTLLSSKYKMLIIKLLDGLDSLNFKLYPDFNNQAEMFIRKNINDDTELSSLIREFNLIKIRKEEEAREINDFINSFHCIDKVKKLHEQIN